jgi:hypothetical protein
MKTICLIAFAAVMATACQTVDLTPQSSHVVAVKAFSWKGKTIKAGDHVRIKAVAGTFKPRDTGHSIDVRAEPGRTGIVLGGATRGDATATDEPIQVVLIRFDEQVWHDTSSSGAEVALAPFEATIHADYVEAVK